MVGEVRLIIHRTVAAALKNREPPSPNASFFISLIDPDVKKTIAFKTVAGNKSLKHIFGTDPAHFPQIGKQQSPFKNVPTEEELKDILKADVTAAGPDVSGHLVYRRGREEADDEDDVKGELDEGTAAVHLIENIGDPNFEGTGHICRLPSPALNDLAAPVIEKVAAGGEVMCTEDMTCSVLPCDTILRLEHNAETQTYTTVLRGTMVWIIWPHTPHNSEVLRKSYTDQANGLGRDMTAVIDDLQDGMFLGTMAGEGLRIPPFCLVMGIATETTVLATYRVMFVDDFLRSLGILALYNSWFGSEAVCEDLHRSYSKGFPKFIKQILWGRFDGYGPAAFINHKDTLGPMNRMIRIWDHEKNEIFNLLDPNGRAAMRDIWRGVLDTLSPDSCAICEMPFTGSQIFDVDRHFDEAHWLGSSPHDPAGRGAVSEE